MAKCAICGKTVGSGVVVHKDCLPQWISVKDRLPEYNGQFLAVADDLDYVGIPWDTRMVIFAAYEDGNWLPNETTNRVVTHWRPMPELPEEESE